MQVETLKAAARRAVVRSVDVVFRGYVTTKRCWRCRNLLSKRSIVCSRCGKWQA